MCGCLLKKATHSFFIILNVTRKLSQENKQIFRDLRMNLWYTLLCMFMSRSMPKIG